MTPDKIVTARSLLPEHSISAFARTKRSARKRSVAVVTTVLLLLTTACTSHHTKDRSSMPTAPSSTAGVHVVTMQLQRTFQMSSGSAQGGSITSLEPSELHVSKGVPETSDDLPSTNSVVLVFAAFPVVAVRVPGSCIEHAVLSMYLLRGTGHGSGIELGVYPSALLDLGRGELPPNPLPYKTLLDSRPRATAYPGVVSGWIQTDVTDLYRLWIDGGPFPGEDATIPLGTPFVVSIQATDLTPDTFDRVFSGGSGDGKALVLKVSSLSGGGCP